jgi:hypothetical protein
VPEFLNLECDVTGELLEETLCAEPRAKTDAKMQMVTDVHETEHAHLVFRCDFTLCADDEIPVRQK